MSRRREEDFPTMLELKRKIAEALAYHAEQIARLEKQIAELKKEESK